MTSLLRDALSAVGLVARPASVGVSLLLTLAGPARGQLEGGSVVSRGTFLLRLEPSFLVVDGLYASGAETPLGSHFFLSDIGTRHAPALEPTEARFHELAGGGAVPLRLGKSDGRLSLEEHVVPLDLWYGVLDRVAIGITVPIIRRQMGAILRYSAEGANVGLNPALSAPGAVSDFLGQATSALGEARDAVEGHCAGAGDEEAVCLGGRDLVNEVDGFLSLLETSYEAEEVFPSAGRELGGAIEARWLSLLSQLAGWGAIPPAEVPLAVSALTQEIFRSTVVAPAWPGDGVPVGTPESFFDLGDVEVHAAVRLFDVVSNDGSPFAFRSELSGTFRFATAKPDTLRALAPGTSTRGASGMRVRLESEALLWRHFSVTGLLEGAWFGGREMPLLSPDPSQPFSPGRTRARVKWTPGSHVRVNLVPRFRLGATLVLGVGWDVFRQEADTFSALDPDGPQVSAPDGARTVQSLIAELRYVARASPAADTSPFPFEAFIRVSRSVSGSGPWSPAEQRVDSGVSLVIGG